VPSHGCLPIFDASFGASTVAFAALAAHSFNFATGPFFAIVAADPAGYGTGPPRKRFIFGPGHCSEQLLLQRARSREDWNALSVADRRAAIRIASAPNQKTTREPIPK
jgi:hypothetical protein